MKTQPLFPYQRRVNRFADGRERVGFLVFYGGGKTYLSLKWLETLEAPFPVLVLTLKSMVDDHQWAQEVRKHTNFTVSEVRGSRKQRLEALRRRADIYLCNYDIVRSAPVLQALTKKQFSTVIADESTLLKESRTQRFKKIRRLTGACAYRAILCGKLMLERPEEIWSQMLFLDDGKTFGKSFWKFRHTYMMPGPPWKPYDWTPKPGASEQIGQLLSRSCIRVTKATIEKELPPKRYIEVPFIFPRELRERYEMLRKEFEIELASGFRFETQWAPVRAQKMHQLCQGIFYLPPPDNKIEILHTMKLDWLQDNIPLMVQEGPILIWTQMIRLIPLIEIVLTDVGVKHSTYKGDMPAPFKAKAKEQFTSGKVDVLILSQKAAAQGLNLQRANQAVRVSLDFSANLYENAEDRCHRIGSEVHENVTYYDLVVKNSIDKVVLKVLREKLNMADEILKHIRAVE